MRKIRVKCGVTGEYGYNDEFYRAPNGKYYKNKNVYDNWVIQGKYRNKIIHLINSDILNKSDGNCCGLIVKLINESGLDAKVIYNAIIENYEYIKNLIDKSNGNDSSKVYTIFSITTKRLNKVTYVGCYEIRNKETNDVYIGESINLFGRFTEHICELYENKHHCEKLQEAFNKTHSIRNFTITPIFMTPISSIDKNELKYDSLYLESAFYLIYKKNKEVLYNTKNPYVALKNNSVSLPGYEIDCKEVLQRLVKDKYNVVPKHIHKLIKENLKDLITCDEEDVKDSVVETNAEIKIKDEKSAKTKEDESKGLYRITNILKDFATDGIIPMNYDYQKIRDILIENNLIYIDENSRTIVTQYSLDNNLYVIDRVSVIKGVTVYNYYITEKGKETIKNIFLNLSDISVLRKQLQFTIETEK